MKTVTIAGAAFGRDAREILYSSNASGLYEIYSIPVGGGDPRRLTDSDGESYFIISAFPNDDRILVASDHGGNEQFHLFTLTPDRDLQDVTPGEGTRAEFYGWSHDDESFYFGWNKRTPRATDLYEMDVRSLTPTLVFENDAGYRFTPLFDSGQHRFTAMSNDGRYFALYKTHTDFDSDMYVYDRETGEERHISAHDGEIEHLPQTFDPRTAQLYYLTDRDSEFFYLMRHDVATGEVERIAGADWDIQYSLFSPLGSYRVDAINSNAQIEIRVTATDTGRQVALPERPKGVVNSVTFSRDDQWMAFQFSDSRSPDNLYVHHFASGTTTQLTETLNPEIAPDDLVQAELVRYRSFDGLEIPALLYTPHGARQDGQSRALVFVHGGPGTQTRFQYSAFLQFIVNRGFLVLDINYRGSLGYGKTFQSLNDRKHGDVDVADCVAGKEFLVSTGYVDEDKIGIFGGSFGGYLVLASMTFRPTEFAVGVDLVGVSNLLGMLESIPPMFERNRRALFREFGDPAVDADYLREISPLFHADKITRPLLVLQGANDPRVPQAQSDQIVEAARGNGAIVDYLVFEDEGHGFRKTENRVKAYKTILEFLNQHLSAASAEGDYFRRTGEP